MSDPSDRVEGIVHEPTQVHDGGVDLTVAEVFEVETPGRVDFGGGELEPAARAPVDPVLRNEGDDYGWWDLDPGGYLIEYNESIADGERVVLQTRRAVAERGAFHPTMFVESLPRVPLAVGNGGIRLKENARLSTLLAL